MDLNELIELEISNGYGDANAQAKVCQDIILKAIATSSLSRNITIKGGVVMRSKTRNIRRATQDLDIDFIRLSLSNEAIDTFISKLNCLDGITLKRYGEIEELKQQDYKGKRVFIQLQDDAGNMIVNKLDIGVHTHLNLEQEEYCFDIAFDEEGASVLINTNEQMFAEKLRSLLRLGAISTRYKDIFDMYYLSQHVDSYALCRCLDTCIFSDSRMRENNLQEILARLEFTFQNKNYLKRVDRAKTKWIDLEIDTVVEGIKSALEKCKQIE